MNYYCLLDILNNTFFDQDLRAFSCVVRRYVGIMKSHNSWRWGRGEDDYNFFIKGGLGVENHMAAEEVSLWDSARLTKFWSQSKIKFKKVLTFFIPLNKKKLLEMFFDKKDAATIATPVIMASQ